METANEIAVADRRPLTLQIEFLKMEFDAVQEAIRRSDSMTEAIKNWAIVTWAGSIGLALGKPELASYIGLTSVLPLLFYFVDAWRRKIQRSFIFRIDRIADFLNSDRLDESFRLGHLVGIRVIDPRSRSDWDSPEFRRFTSVFRTILFREVSVFYLGLSALSLVVALLVQTNPCQTVILPNP